MHTQVNSDQIQRKEWCWWNNSFRGCDDYYNHHDIWTVALTATIIMLRILNTDFIPWTVRSLSAQLSSVQKMSHTHIHSAVLHKHALTHSISMAPTALARFRSDYHVKNDKNMFTSAELKLSMPETSSGWYMGRCWGDDPSTKYSHADTQRTQIYKNHWSLEAKEEETDQMRQDYMR